MFSHDRHADAQPEAGAASGALGGEERVEDPRQHLTGDARAVVLENDRDSVLGGPDANVQDPALALPANGLLGVGDQVQEDLNHLIGIAHYSQIGRASCRERLEIWMVAVALNKTRVKG